MARSALRVFSLRGLLVERIEASDIKSRADARKKWPFVDEEHRLLTWVRDSWANGHRKRRQHFRHYASGTGGTKQFSDLVTTEINQIEKHKSESELHKRAKEKLAKCLRDFLQQGKVLPWYYTDKEASDFSLSGDLLSDVVEVALDSYQIKLPTGKVYRPDIALLGPKLKNCPLLLGIIELELSHEAEALKCLWCKATAAPVLTVDLQEASPTDITEEWCLDRLLHTTARTNDRRRRNYIFLHNMLYPVFSDIPADLLYDEQHQFLVFARDTDFEKLHKTIRILQQTLGLTDKDVLIQPVRLNTLEPSSLKMFENEGSIAGAEWREYSKHQYIRVALTRLTNKRGALYQFHIALANLLTLHFDSLVGYKIARRENNSNAESPLWVHKKWIAAENAFKNYRLLPKRVSEPVFRIMRFLDESKMAVSQ